MLEIIELERVAREHHSGELKNFSTLADAAYALAQQSSSAQTGRIWAQVSLSTRINLTLLARLSNDLRSVSILTLSGYAVQALTLGASMYEVAFGMAHIGADDNVAREWVDYNDPYRPFRPMYELIHESQKRMCFSNAQEIANREYEKYRRLCLVKHVNPVYQSRTGWRFDREDNSVVIVRGPDITPTKLAWLAFEVAVWTTLTGLRSFIECHVPPEDQLLLVQRHNNLTHSLKRVIEEGEIRWRGG